MSSGCRATTTYAARGSSGSPSSGVCVLTNRRCRCASSRANTSSTGSTRWSTHGDNVVNGAGRSGVPRTSSAQIICIHVVPDFERVEMTMSPSRNGKPDQRVLSSSDDR